MSYDKVSLLLPMNGANDGTVFTDWSPVPKTVTATGPITSTAQFKYYDSSGFFDGTNDYLSVAVTADDEFPTEDFTIRGWIRPAQIIDSALFVNIMPSATQAAHGIQIAQPAADPSKIRFAAGDADTAVFEAVITSTISISVGTWVHIEFSRSGSTFRLFMDGVADGTATWAGSIAFGGQPWIIGANRSSGQFFSGYMQDVEILNGVALHTANFTPPARLIGTISNAAVGADNILDINGDPAERTVIAVPRSAPTRIWSDVSNASGEFEIQAPAGVDHSVVALADEATLYNDIVHRVIPE